jgi:hypothetical protein
VSISIIVFGGLLLVQGFFPKQIKKGIESIPRSIDLKN